MTEGSPLEKTQPEDIVDAVITEIKKKEFEIFPDKFSQMVKTRLAENPNELIKEFASYLQYN